MTHHLPLSEIADHVTKKTVLDAAALRHLDTCPHCRSDLSWLEALGSLRRFEPPKAAIDRALQYFSKKKDAA
jgi:hypothetical protein